MNYTPGGTGPTTDVAQVLEKVDYLVSLFQRRLQEDRAKEQLIQGLLASLDDRGKLDTGEAHASLFREALLAIDRLLSEESSKDLSESVADELLTIFFRRGLARIPTDGRIDSSVHEVSGMAADCTGKEHCEIVFVEREGYMLGGRVLRPARVRIANTESSD